MQLFAIRPWGHWTMNTILDLVAWVLVQGCQSSANLGPQRNIKVKSEVYFSRYLCYSKSHFQTFFPHQRSKSFPTRPPVVILSHFIVSLCCHLGRWTDFTSQGKTHF